MNNSSRSEDLSRRFHQKFRSCCFGKFTIYRSRDLFVVLCQISIFTAAFWHPHLAYGWQEKADRISPPEQPPASIEPQEERTVEFLPPEDHLVTWLHSLEKGRDLARTRRAPLIVVAGATWCGPCRLQETEIKQPIAQEELQRWVAVHLDVDDYPDEASALAVASIPAIRLLTPDGRLVASRDGVQPGNELAAWLKQQYATATLNASAEQVPGRLTALSAIALLKNFRSRESTVRESAISRLATVPEVAAAPVVANFAESGLAEQLAYLELLNSWNAPVDGIDPWIPDTVTAERITELETWVRNRKFTAIDNSDELTPVEIIEAVRIIRNLKTADSTEAVAFREQLARMGDKTLPLIRSALEGVTSPTARQRLMEAKYRVAATAELDTEWPGGLEQLADPVFEVRVEAAAELVALATRREERLLLELFGDRAPFIRELAMKGLVKVSGTNAAGALVNLLEDSDANVRAAVLKQLAEQPAESLIGRISEYAREESDPDLVVHAVRFLREIQKPAAVKAMSELLNHSSWRVRAEAADGISRLIRKSGMSAARTDTTLGQAILNLLNDEDDYVVGIAIPTLRYVNAPDAANRLVAVAESRPAVAAKAVEALGTSYIGRREINERLMAFTTAEQPEVRIAAAAALLKHSPAKYADGLRRTLADEDRVVRTTLADAIFARLSTELAPQLKKLRSTRPANKATPPVDSENTSPDTVGRTMAEDYGAKVDARLIQLRNDRKLPAWIYGFEEPLKQLQKSSDLSEQVAAAITLQLIGNEKAFDVLKQAASDVTQVKRISSTFAYLPWSEKVILIKLAASAAKSRDDLFMIADELADSRDNRSPPQIWQLLTTRIADARLVADITKPLKQSYFAAYHSTVSDAEKHEQDRLRFEVGQMIATGNQWQKLAAMQLLAEVDIHQLQESAAELFDDQSQDAPVRADAIRIMLCFASAPQAEQLAVAALQTEQSDVAQCALRFLTLGRSTERYLSGVIPLPVGETKIPIQTNPQPIQPVAPDGLTAEAIRPFLTATDQLTAVGAAYHLVLLGETKHIEPVVSYWMQNPRDHLIRRLAYRAIAAADNDQHVNLLRQMYLDLKTRTWGSWSADFYLTVRSMKSEAAINLTSQIRSENDAAEKALPVP